MLLETAVEAPFNPFLKESTHRSTHLENKGAICWQEPEEKKPQPQLEPITRELVVQQMLVEAKLEKLKGGDDLDKLAEAWGKTYDVMENQTGSSRLWPDGAEDLSKLFAHRLHPKEIKKAYDLEVATHTKPACPVPAKNVYNQLVNMVGLGKK